MSWSSFSSLVTSSITSVTDSVYSFFSAFSFSIFEFISFRDFSKSSISLLLPKIFTVFVWIEPPVIAPVLLIMSPSNVTILKEYELSFAIWIAVSIFSTIKVLPRRLSTICSYLLLHLTKSDATPITPSVLFLIILSNFLPLIDETGKKDALPNLFFLKCSTNFLASSSVSVTMFWRACPKHISIAVSYFLSTEIRFAKTPFIPFPSPGFFSQSTSIDFTLLI